MTAISASTGVAKPVYLGLVAIYAVVVGLWLITSVRNGSWLGAVAAALCASPIPYALLAQFYEDPRVPEDRSVAHLIADYQHQSWAFYFGDTFFLPFSAAMAALAWKHAPQLRHTWATSWQWTLVSGLLGAAAGYTFRHVVDGPGYGKAGAMGSFNAPTKLLHDWCSYPVLAGGLVCVIAPLLFQGLSRQWPFLHVHTAPYVWWALVGLGLWAGAGIWHDLGLFGQAPLQPRNLHPNSWRWASA